MKKLSRIFAVCFLLVGCTSKVIITPDKLRDAKFGEPYYAKINIEGGSGPISVSGFRHSISPINSGLTITFSKFDDNISYNNIAIYGTPTTTESITVKLQGAMIPTGWNASSEFKKTYVIKVKEAD